LFFAQNFVLLDIFLNLFFNMLASRTFHFKAKPDLHYQSFRNFKTTNNVFSKTTVRGLSHIPETKPLSFSHYGTKTGVTKPFSAYLNQTRRTMVSFASTTGVVSPIKNTGIVPDVWAKDFLPTVPLTIKWNETLELSADGQELTPADTAKTPNIEYIAPDLQGLYTLAKVDPDAPSREDPKFREWRHWLVVNIPGSDIVKGQTISSYMGPGPPPKTGLHRYIFLLFKQTGTLHVPTMNDQGMNRASFKISEFAKQFNLGDPIGCAHFQAKNPTQE